MDKQVFANHDFTKVKSGLTITYSTPPYQEERRTAIWMLDEYGSDAFYIKIYKKVKGEHKQIKIKIF